MNNNKVDLKTENVVADAMKILTAALNEDKEPGSYYFSWQSNLAMKILDNCNNKLDADECNIIAKKFLDFLISQNNRSDNNAIS
jgi:hypothetical protein